MRRSCSLPALMLIAFLSPVPRCLWGAPSEATTPGHRSRDRSVFVGGERRIDEATSPIARLSDDPGGIGKQASLPDLVFYKPRSWPAQLVISKTGNTHTNDVPIPEGRRALLDFALTNDGAYSSRASFFCDIYVDDELVWVVDINYSFSPYYYVPIEDINLGTLPAGLHTVRVILDSENEIREANEDNNTRTLTFMVTKVNEAPAVDAGPNQTVRPETLVTLSAIVSDPDDDPLTYTWSQQAGETVELSDPSAPVVTFTAPSTYAVLQFLLRVSDGLHAPVDSVTVTVDPNHNNLPTADAGPDLSGVSGEAMSVTGSGADPDGGAVSFTWLQLAGTTEAPSIDLIDADQATVNFTPPEWDCDYDILLQLTVTDIDGGSTTDTARIRVDSPDPHKVVVPYSLQASAAPGEAEAADTGLLDGTFVGVVLANPSQLSESSAELEARTWDGASVYQEVTSIPAEGQRSFLASEFTGDGTAASLTARGWTLPLQGFFLIGESALNRLDGIGGGLAEGTALRFLMATSSAGKETFLLLFNTGREAADEVSLELHGRDGETLSARTISIAAGGTLRSSVADLLDTGGELQEGYVTVRSEVPLRGFELVADASTFSALTGQSANRVDRLSAPHFFAAPDGGSVLRILNPDIRPVRITVTAHHDDGSTMAEAAATIDPGELLVEDLADFLGLDASSATLTGYLEVTPDLTALETGRLLVGSLTFRGAGYASTLPLIRQGRRETLFLHVAQSSELKIFTGLALQNPNPEEATVSVEIYSADGMQTASRTRTLPPGERVVDLLNGTEFMGAGFEQVNGHIKVKSDLPIVSFALFGADDLSYMSAIEGQAPQLETGVFEVTRNTCGDNMGPELLSIEPDPRLGMSRIPTGRSAGFRLRFRDDSEQTNRVGEVQHGLTVITLNAVELSDLGIQVEPHFIQEQDPDTASLQFGFPVPSLEKTTEVTVSVTAVDVQTCETVVRFSFVLEKK